MATKKIVRIAQTKDAEGRRCWYIQSQHKGIWVEESSPNTYYAKYQAQEAAMDFGYKIVQ